jgi:hypothetical protein
MDYSDKIARYQEIERRGLLGSLPPEKQAIWAEYKRRQQKPELTPLSDEQKAKPKGDYSDGVAIESLKGLGKGILGGLSRVASGATFGATDWLDRRLGGNITALNEDLQQSADDAGLGGWNKLANFAADVGGNIKGAGGKLAIKIADKGYKGLGNVLMNSGIGGGLFGLTSSDKLSDVPSNVLANATLGTIFGTGLYGAGKGGLYLYDTVRPYANAANKAVGNAIEKIGLGNLKEMAEKAAQKGRSILEVGDDDVITATQDARQQSKKAYQNTEKAARDFFENQADRNSNVINDAFGNKGKYENTDDVVRLAKEQAAPIYEKLHNTGDLAESNPQILKNIAKNPYLRQEVGAVLKDPLYQAEYSGQKLSPTDWRVLDQTNRSINDKISAAVRAGEADKVRLLERQKYELLNQVDDIVPEYKVARGIYEAENKALKAQKIGENALFDNNTSPEKLSRTMKDMTDYEKRSLKIGAREKLLNTVESKENQALGLKKLNNKQTQGKLKLVLGKKADDFINYANDEVAAMRNFNEITKGSQTSEKLSAKDRLSLIGKILKNPTGLLGEVGQAMSGRINNASNDVLTQMLLEKGGSRISNEIENYLAREAGAGKLRDIASILAAETAKDVLKIQ